MSQRRLSKSKIVLGKQCEKALYFSVHKPELADEISDSQQLIFDQGHEVGLLAQSHYPGGFLVDAPYDKTDLAIAQTEKAISDGALSIFEATFIHDDVLVKVDILNRKTIKSSWEIIEVKSSTEVKEVHAIDAAVQLWVCRGAGLKVKSVAIRTINNQCLYPDLKNLFNTTDITNEVEATQKNLPKLIKSFKSVLSSKKVPNRGIGPHCDDPYSCGFKSHCWRAHKIPEISVFDIPRLSSDKKWDFFNKGVVDLSDLDPDEFNQTQKRMINCSVGKSRFIDKPAIRKELQKWSYPLSFLDFETIGFAIPRYQGQRPYQQLPFQFSCHLKTSPTSKLEHREFLNLTNKDPREDLAKALVSAIPSKGNVVAYNMGFENGVIKALAEQFPKLKTDLLDISERLVDPLPIFRAHVYDPQFKGSFSIKEVAPAILGNAASYEGMNVGDGSEAQSVYLRMIDEKTSAKDKEKHRKDLIEYCTKDTLGMVLLVDWLFKQTN